MAEKTLTGRIVRLEVDNVKRLKAVRIKPDGNLIVVSGANDAGKSSVLDSIRFALGGPAAMKDTPEVIRKGEIAAKVLLELEHVTVTRKMIDGKQSVVIESKDGSVFGSPQGKLDDALSALTFDPLKFARMPAKEQRKILLDMLDLGIDLDAVEEERGGVFARRTVVGRERDRLSGMLSTAPSWATDPATPTEAVGISDALAVVESAVAHNAHRAELEAEATRAASDLDDGEDRESQAAVRLEAARESLARLREAHTVALRAAAEAAPEIDVAPLREKLDGVEVQNSHIRDRANYLRAEADRNELAAGYAALTADLDAIEKSKQDALAAAKMPIDGLGISEDGVTFNGLPLSQASESQRAKTSARIQMSLNPDLRVMLIDNGNAFDPRNLEVLAGMAAEYDYQIWTTYVGDSGRPQIVIEDGEVQS